MGNFSGGGLVQAGLFFLTQLALQDLAGGQDDQSGDFLADLAFDSTRDAIALIPREKLEVGQTYTVTVIVDGENATWSFDVIHPPQ